MGVYSLSAQRARLCERGARHGALGTDSSEWHLMSETLLPTESNNEDPSFDDHTLHRASLLLSRHERAERLCSGRGRDRLRSGLQGGPRRPRRRGAQASPRNLQRDDAERHQEARQDAEANSDSGHHRDLPDAASPQLPVRHHASPSPVPQVLGPEEGVPHQREGSHPRREERRGSGLEQEQVDESPLDLRGLLNTPPQKRSAGCACRCPKVGSGWWGAFPPEPTNAHSTSNQRRLKMTKQQAIALIRKAELATYRSGRK